MNIMVTGGYGFIGSNFVQYWYKNHKDDFIINVDKCTYAAVRDNLLDVEQDDARYQFIRADICDFEKINEIVNKWKVEVIVNFAAESHNSNSILDPTTFYQTNVMGTQNLLEVCRRNKGVKRVHHISTCEVYGDMSLESDIAFCEQSPLGGNSPYSSSKACGNLIAAAYYKTYGIPVTISVCSNNYGPYQFPEKVIPLFITNAIQGKPLTLYQESDHKREWLHVHDHCRAIEAILLKGEAGQIYNVGSGVEKSVEELASIVLGYFNLPATFKTYIKSRPSHDTRYLLDTAKIKEKLGWEAQISFEMGIKETIRWYQENQQWWESLLGRRIAEDNQWN